MIPKIIHYCWFGGNPIPEAYENYMESWKKYCPDYEIKRWDETNFDLNSCDFVKEAYEAKKWAFVSDYARLKIIYDEGGIYLDTDVELIKNLDFLLDNKCFLAEEVSGYIATGLGFGAEKNSPIVGRMLAEYSGHFSLEENTYDTVPCPRKNTAPLIQMGYEFSGKNIWENGNVKVYPPEYFCPMDYETGRTTITENTISIHHYSASWKSKTEDLIFNISRICIIIFGRKKGIKVARVIDFPFRVINKVEQLGIKATFRFAMKELSKR